MSTFANNVILITGAGSGLGAEMARQLLKRGAAVGAIDVVPESLSNLRAEAASTRLHISVADVADRTALSSAVREVEQALGPCDRLIANAGIGIGTPALQFSSADFETVVRVNLLGVANSVEAVLPGMLQRRRGHLVAISSLASLRGVPIMGAYCAAKAGVNALFDALRVELRGSGVKTTTICPGWIRTPLTAPFESALRTMLSVDDAAVRILRAIERERSFVAFPLRVGLSMYLARFVPWLGDRLLALEMNKLRSRLESQG